MLMNGLLTRVAPFFVFFHPILISLMFGDSRKIFSKKKKKLITAVNQDFLSAVFYLNSINTHESEKNVVYVVKDCIWYFYFLFYL